MIGQVKQVRAAGPSRSSSVVVRAQAGSSRRALLGAVVLPFVAYAPKALALIPDEEDEELLEKAKANRKSRLQQQQVTTRSFIADEGLKNKKLEQELIPVQKAVYQLAKSGAQLEAGDLRGAASTLSGGWVEEFKKAAENVSTASAEAVVAGIGSVREAAGKGDAKASKKQYVALVAAVQGWASDAGLAGALKGL